MFLVHSVWDVDGWIVPRVAGFSNGRFADTLESVAGCHVAAYFATLQQTHQSDVMFTSVNLQQFINTNSIDANIVHLAVDTQTVADAAAAVGVVPEQIIKSVLFLADNQPVLVIGNGLTRIDPKKLADYLGASRRRVKSANAAQVLVHTGYVAGSVPPFGHLQPLRTIVQTAVLSQHTIFGGGGDMHALMKMTVAELQRVVGAETAVLSENVLK
jgi:prolyl-tRNA editing enzyme YbaK/EbsC (Cys-tRNA(Pro) deacylase)